jgi:hypothetical protein
LFVTHYVDTVTTGGGPLLPVESDFSVEDWCVDVPDEHHRDIGHAHLLDCQAAGPADMILDEDGPDEVILQFTRSGDDMTITGLAQANLEYDFGSGTAEPATLFVTLESVILDIERPDVVRCVSAC